MCHLIGHVLGYFHENARPDRDNYVKINYNNIIPNMDIEFLSYPSVIINNYNLSYDYASIMHFGGLVRFDILFQLIFIFCSSSKKEYSKNKTQQNKQSYTIETLNPAYQNTIGQRVGLSYQDIKLANIVYCSTKMTTCSNATCQRNGYINPKTCNNTCICPDGFTGSLCDRLDNCKYLEIFSSYYLLYLGFN